MTEKQFWMKLDQIAGNSDKITEFIRILRQGYFPMQNRRVSIPLNCLMRKKSSLSSRGALRNKVHNLLLPNIKPGFICTAR